MSENLPPEGAASTSTGTLPPPASPRGRFPTWLKVLLGCGVGCGGLLLAGFLAAGYGMWWITSSGKQIATSDIVRTDAANVLRIDAAETDGDLAQAVVTLFMDFQSVQQEVARESTPDSMAWIDSLQQMQNAGGASGLTTYVPREVTVVLEPGLDGVPQAVVAVNLRAFPRLIKWVVSMASSQQGGAIREAEHAGVSYRVFDETAGLAFLGGTMIWAQSESALIPVLERLEAAEPAAGENEGMPLLVTEPGAWEIQGRLDAAGLRYFLQDDEQGPEPEQLSHLSGVEFGVDVLSADGLTGFAAVQGNDRGYVEQWVAELFADLSATAAGEGMELQYELRPDEGDPLWVDFRLDGIREAIRRSVRESMQRDH